MPHFHTRSWRLVFLLVCCVPTGAPAQTIRRWTVSDGLPTAEVQQIIELPNGQMLVNCEGVFCLSDGRAFNPVSCERQQAYRLKHYTQGYAHWWQGDSLLWLRDFYRLFLFDTRTRSFRYDIAHRLDAAGIDERWLSEPAVETVALPFVAVIDSLGLKSDATMAVADRQQGLWIGTWHDGIVYLPPRRPQPQLLTRTEGFDLLEPAGKPAVGAGVKALEGAPLTVVCPLPDRRTLLCYDLNRMGYLSASGDTFTPLHIEALDAYRRIIAACPVGPSLTAVFTQNGAFVIDTEADTLAPFVPASDIERYSDKYNCTLRHSDGSLWVGTQNGLFVLDVGPVPTGRHEGAGRPSALTQPRQPYTCKRVEGLANNCIRSLAQDAKGRVWIGTAYGISMVSATSAKQGEDPRMAVVNYGPDDGIPAVSMSERAAGMTADGRLVFIHGGGAIAFRPEWMTPDHTPFPVVLTSVSASGHSISHRQNNLSFAFSTLNYAAPSHTHYRYRLLPIEEEWQRGESDGRSGTATYRALSPGRYTFEAQASAGNGPWGESARWAFVIRPPWWLTWWAKLIYSVAAMLAISGVASIYARRKRAVLVRENDARVNRLFELRDEARHQFAQSIAIDPRKISANTEEEELVQRMLKAIAKNLDNADYGVDQLARDVAVSRSVLYDKLRIMLGISPAEFIRGVRLKRAAELLADTRLSVTEVSERVGFNSPRVFSLNFRKMFGVLPSEYREPKA